MYPNSADATDLVLYVVGADEQDAKRYQPFDDYKLAREFADENGLLNIYSVSASIDWDTIEVQLDRKAGE